MTTPTPAPLGSASARSVRVAMLHRRLRRAVLRHRGLLAAALLAAALAVAVGAARPPPPATVPMVVAARELTGDRPLADADVRTVRIDPDLVPDGALPPDAVPYDRLVAGPVRTGEPLTDAALVGPGLAARLPAGEVLTTIHVRDPAADLLQPGDVVHVVAADPRVASPAEVVADSATVMTIPQQTAEAGAAGTTPLVLAVPESTALELTAAATTRVLDVLVPAPAP